MERSCCFKNSENKEFLFGKFDETAGLTKEKRKAKWNTIHSELNSLGYPVGKDGEYLRDTSFSNLKKRALVSRNKYVPISGLNVT